MQLFLSPHLDDIALSCGGHVRQLTNAGQRVVIASVCTADLPPGAPLSPSAQHEHWQWQLGDQPYALRRQEDVRVAAQLGAEYIHLGLLDAIYRSDDDGAPLYEGKQFMGGVVHPLDWERQLPALSHALEPLLASLNPQHVFCPLTAGGHVDHLITQRAVEQLCNAQRLVYYEDYPYAQKDSEAIARALGNPQAWRSTLYQLTPAEIEVRIAAIACYNSQLAAVFGAAAAMPALVREYIARTGGERYWERD